MTARQRERGTGKNTGVKLSNVNLRLFPKVPQFRRCRRRRLRPPRCLRWWQKWQSRARWHRGKPVVAPPAGEEQHWPRSRRVSDPCCSRRLAMSPWRHPSLRGSENEGWRGRGQGWITKLLLYAIGKYDDDRIWPLHTDECLHYDLTQIILPELKHQTQNKRMKNPLCTDHH